MSKLPKSTLPRPRAAISEIKINTKPHDLTNFVHEDDRDLPLPKRPARRPTKKEQAERKALVRRHENPRNTSIIETPYPQAHRIIEKFGGIMMLVAEIRAAGYRINTSTVYKWTYPKSKGGSGGLIPTQSWPAVFDAARRAGLTITPSDIDPRPRTLQPQQTFARSHPEMRRAMRVMRLKLKKKGRM